MLPAPPGTRRRMRLTIVLGPFKPPPPAPSGAVEKVWWSIARELARRGHAVTVVGADHPDLPRGEGWEGVSYRRMPLLDRSGRLWRDVLRDLGWSRRARRLLPDADVTITNCVWLPWLLGGPSARRRLGILEVHVQRFPKGQMRLYKRVDSISTVSRAIADAIAAERPELAPRIRVVPNPVDLEVFRPSVPPRPPGDPPVLLYTGRLHPEKRLDLLVGAWRTLLDEGRRLRLRLVGPSSREAGGGGAPLLDRLRALARGAEVEIVGAVADPRALAEELRGADLYAYPSTAAQGEALPVAPLEAMACGLAPVVAALPQYEGVVVDGEHGLAFPLGLGDAEATRALADRLRRLLGDPVLRARLGRTAAEHMHGFSVESLAGRHLEDLAALAGRRAT